MASVFHEGEQAIQRQAGVAAMAERVGNGIHHEIPPAAAEFLGQQPFAILGATDARGRVWASFLSGAPGFLQVEAATTVHIATVLPDSDPLFGVLAPGKPVAVGMLMIEPATRRRMRLNGTAEWLPEGAGLRVRAREVYANCPKYIQKREIAAVDRSAQIPAVHSSGLSAAQRTWITGADTFFIATAHPDAGADASHRGGNPGFVRVSADGVTLYWGDYSGNMMFNTLGNLQVNPNAGLLFVDFDGSGSTLQLTGTARILWGEEATTMTPEAERAIAFQVEEVVETTGAFPWRYTFDEFSRFNPAV